MTILDRFAAKYRIASTGCWIWTAANTGPGHALRYGRFYESARRRVVLAHRFSYEAFVGPIPPKMDLDHLCRNPLCVNPSHLEPVDRRTNILRGTSINAVNAAKTHCVNGHELTQDNCYASRWPKARQCKLCARNLSRSKYAASKRQTNNLASAERNALALRRAIEEIN